VGYAKRNIAGTVTDFRQFAGINSVHPNIVIVECVQLFWGRLVLFITIVYGLESFTGSSNNVLHRRNIFSFTSIIVQISPV
jgi:hypothetical protein